MDLALLEEVVTARAELLGNGSEVDAAARKIKDGRPPCQVASIARQLAVDCWRWRTGKVTPQALGWVMVGPPA